MSQQNTGCQRKKKLNHTVQKHSSKIIKRWVFLFQHQNKKEKNRFLRKREATFFDRIHLGLVKILNLN